MSNKRPFTYRGQQYSLQELADLAGISIGAMWVRHKNNWSVERMVETPKASRSRRKSYPYKGQMYDLQELASLAGLCLTTLGARIQVLGWTVEQAVETPVQRH